MRIIPSQSTDVLVFVHGPHLMSELLHTLLLFLIVFATVFALNVAPAFAPPTWSVVSYIAVRYRLNIVALAVFAAVAATLGRLVLAKLSSVILRQRFLSDDTKKNIDVVKSRLEQNQKLSFSIFLFYAFSPLPSNHLFIAYGLTELKLRLISVPFFIGRVVSYAFWAFTASSVVQFLKYEQLGSSSFFSFYFVATQLFALFMVYVFTKIDWQTVFTARKVRWRKQARSSIPR